MLDIKHLYDNIALVSNHLLSGKNTDYSYISRTVSQKQVDSVIINGYLN